MLKVLIITQNEPFYIPKMLRYILEKQNDIYKVTGISILKPHRKNKNYRHWLKERTSIYTFFELLLTFSAAAWCKFHSAVFRNSPYSVRKVATLHGIEMLDTKDINAPDYIQRIRNSAADVIISISCPQLFGEEILKSARYCINAHGTLLPRHRGVFGSWWTLFSGDRYGGSTIHTMELRLDAGQILWQKEFLLENDSQYSIASKTKSDMAEGLVQVLGEISRNEIKNIPPKYETSYHRAPGKELAKQFRTAGYRIIRLRDLPLILRKKFKPAS